MNIFLNATRREGKSKDLQFLRDGSPGTECRGVGGWEKLPQRAAILQAVPKGQPERFQEDDFSRTSWLFEIRLWSNFKQSPPRIAQV